MSAVSAPAAVGRAPVSIVPAGAVGLGIQLPVQARSRLFAEDWEHTAGVEELVAVARAAEDAGLLYVGVCDHVAVPTDRAETMGTTWFDPWSTLAYLAAVTTRVRLLTHVAVVALRHPLQTAKTVATLDHLSGGRVILGVGAGHVEEEFAALDVPFAGRGARLDEAIDAIRAALTDEVPTHEGEVWRFSGVGVAPRPVQAAVPIWVGGSSPAALRRVAARGDGWLPQGTRLSALPDQLAVLAEASGREPASYDLGATAPPMYLGAPSWDVGPHTRVGSADELAERIDRYAAAGCRHVQVRFRSRDASELVDQLARAGDELLPALRERRPVTS
ncbi:TIGR03619 family F420-dependent LLM class oxidoreductase [Nitriliruptor alkaliphilus]|uniref:TIGR03619 family F420-dependent LLM class oxidoreductase n=1 Tax=Nitriliruptor alkaliphilus TaxID=427918 RepID=UPI001B805104|nr:TIGR03619 family F420-dependent LLM class oxidoreductase [Nitriliruptor alkaliphilus]